MLDFFLPMSSVLQAGYSAELQNFSRSFRWYIFCPPFLQHSLISWEFKKTPKDAERFLSRLRPFSNTQTIKIESALPHHSFEPHMLGGEQTASPPKKSSFPNRVLNMFPKGKLLHCDLFIYTHDRRASEESKDTEKISF